MTEAFGLWRRSCWRRVDELEDEEDSLNHRLTRLENIVRGERMEVGSPFYLLFGRDSRKSLAPKNAVKIVATPTWIDYFLQRFKCAFTMIVKVHGHGPRACSAEPVLMIGNHVVVPRLY